MTRNDLYQLAFRYKKTGLWKKIWDTELFAIELSSGEIGYISIMGRLGEYCAISLYIGDEGIHSFRLVANAERIAKSELEYHELMVQQKSLQLVFDRKDELMSDEVEEVRAYAKANGIRLSGKNAYPQFVKCAPNYCPWKIETEAELQALYESVEAAILLSELLGKRDPLAVGIRAIGPDTKEVPIFHVKENQLEAAGFVRIPEEKETLYEPLVLRNDILMASMKRLPKQGVWETEFIRMMQPIQNDPGEAPYFPAVLLMVEKDSQFVIPVFLDLGMEENAQTFFQEFCGTWKTQKIYAKEIRCRNERTYLLLKDFCEKTGVKIQLYDKEMEALDEAVYNMFEGLGNEEEEIIDQMAQITEAILSMTPAELREIPKPMLLQIKEMVNQGIFPPQISEEIEAKLRKLKL